MIKITEKTNIDNAVAKAREVKPLLKVTGFGTFEVTGSTGTGYTVTFNHQATGLVGDCSCPGGKNGRACCYHLAASYGVYKLQVRNRAATKAALDLEAPEMASCKKCGREWEKQAISLYGLCPDCELHDL